MELAAEKLEALVLQAEVTLDSLLNELEEKLSEKAGVQLKPSYLISSIEEMQTELLELKKESDTLIQNQADVKAQLEKELQVACRKIQNLQSKTGCKIICANTAGSALKTRFDNMNM